MYNCQSLPGITRGFSLWEFKTNRNEHVNDHLTLTFRKTSVSFIAHAKEAMALAHENRQFSGLDI